MKLKLILVVIGVLTSCAASKSHKCDAYGLKKDEKNLEITKTFTTFDKV